MGGRNVRRVGAALLAVTLVSLVEKACADGPTMMNLYLLNNTEESGAVCLDGTPAGFWFSPATNASNKNDWQL